MWQKVLIRLDLGAGEWVVDKVSGAQRLQNMPLRRRVVPGGTNPRKSMYGFGRLPRTLNFSFLIIAE